MHSGIWDSIDIFFSTARYVLYSRLVDKHLCLVHNGSGFLALDSNIQTDWEIKIPVFHAMYFCLIRFLSEENGKFTGNFRNSGVFNLALVLQHSIKYFHKCVQDQNTNKSTLSYCFFIWSEISYGSLF